MASGGKGGFASTMTERPVATVAELVASGVPRHAVDAAVASGRLARIMRGVVANPDVAGHGRIDDVALTLVTGGIIVGRSAAALHGLNDDSPDQTEILVPFGRSRVPSGIAARVIRSRMPQSYTLGVEGEVILGVEVRVTGKARTVVDLYRDRAREVRQHALRALLTHLDESDPTELFNIAAAFDLDGSLAESLTKDVEALRLNAGSRPPKE